MPKIKSLRVEKSIMNLTILDKSNCVYLTQLYLTWYINFLCFNFIRILTYV